jgi:hypothetical protein
MNSSHPRTFRHAVRGNAATIVILELLTFQSLLSTCFAQGSLTPPGAPAPAMKSLAQVEPRVPISSAPFTISSAGSYYLTTNLTVSGGDAITIAASGVTLDLNGFTISSSAAVGTGTGIKLNDGIRNIAVFNGHILSGVTNNSGSFSGGGFAQGVSSGNSSVNVRVSSLSVSGVLTYGILLNQGESTMVENCTVRTVGGSYGIVASSVRNCVALDCAGTAIQGGQVMDCRGESVEPSNGDGVHAQIAVNCLGFSQRFYGVFATRTATGCFGQSASGTGLHAENAAFCVGYRPGGIAIEATVANGCYAENGGTAITNKYNMP